MSKEIYIVNCYTCQHNGQETCKGCNTLLNGDVEPYENWELREDLSQKDQRIAELEKQFDQLKQQLAEKDTRIAELEEQNNRLIDTLKEKDKENEELKLKLDIRAMSLQNINIERMESEQNQTRLAIQELEKVKILLQNAIKYEGHTFVGIYDAVNNQIRKLKGE